MQQTTYTLRFLTPCFCAGADQTRREIRPPSIRGQLRWWFRALGGTPNAEDIVFGGIRGDDDKSSASALVVRVAEVKLGPAWNPPRVDPNHPSSYVWYYASVSADKRRWNSDSAFPPQTSFKLQIAFRRTLAPDLQSQFDNALHCFLALGGIGMRVTRGLGAFACDEYPFAANATAVRAILTKAGFQIEQQGDYADMPNVIREIGTRLKESRKTLNMKADKTQSPFGASKPRQTSAVYFRPIATHANATTETKLALVVFVAPQTRVLAPAARHPIGKLLAATPLANE